MQQWPDAEAHPLNYYNFLQAQGTAITEPQSEQAPQLEDAEQLNARTTPPLSYELPVPRRPPPPTQ